MNDFGPLVAQSRSYLKWITISGLLLNVEQ